LRRKALGIIVLVLAVLTFVFAVPVLRVNPCYFADKGGCPYFPPDSYPSVSLTRYYSGVGGQLGPPGPIQVYIWWFGYGHYVIWRL
jgi:hypothetical protein